MTLCCSLRARFCVMMVKFDNTCIAKHILALHHKKPICPIRYVCMSAFGQIPGQWLYGGFRLTETLMTNDLIKPAFRRQTHMVTLTKQKLDKQVYGPCFPIHQFSLLLKHFFFFFFAQTGHGTYYSAYALF